ncbi:MBL fold metallo-hydrolase [Jannaschia sp. M317]|uniref:MBL fold metallo-hydrolase n=1 Tax=Jannaschia sp. M317 TaxID=2867011 RepID=UPI0021A30233|nr:MBL fold metallo-hydrolase [Jannaschia sp. M317]UWQ16125.1 MBL fold metallo-hydrolase [Jannaschia sp. M317]
MSKGYSAHEADESGLLRILAPNPSPMTEAGTNSYILGTEDLVIIDPGPADAAHMHAIVQAIRNRPVQAILVTHSHLDHSPAARPLSDQLDAPVLAFGASDTGRSDLMRRLSDRVGGGEGVDTGFCPDTLIGQGDVLSGQGWTLHAHHTPGHMANHLSFEWPEGGTVFTGDTVMGWASTLISPPDGDLGQFMTSLTRLEQLPATRFLPGHGRPCAPARCAEMRSHRLTREAAILATLTHPRSIAEVVAEVYRDTPAALHGAAARNVLAHLVYLAEAGRVTARPGIDPDALWQRS